MPGVQRKRALEIPAQVMGKYQKACIPGDKAF
jgi:hypothetical protein